MLRPITLHSTSTRDRSQDVVRVSHRDTPLNLMNLMSPMRKERDIERSVLLRAVAWHLDDRVLVYDNETAVFD